MADIRLQRVGNLIRELISTMILKKEIKDPRVSTLLSVSRVKVAKDLSMATVWISGYMEAKDLESGVEGLNHGSGFIQHQLGKKLKTRQTPRLRFRADHGIEKGFEITKKIEEANS